MNFTLKLKISDIRWVRSRSRRQRKGPFSLTEQQWHERATQAGLPHDPPQTGPKLVKKAA